MQPNHIGSFQQEPVLDPQGPTLGSPKFWILMETGGYRRLQPEEWSKIKGYPKAYIFPPKLLPSIVALPSVHE